MTSPGYGPGRFGLASHARAVEPRLRNATENSSTEGSGLSTGVSTGSIGIAASACSFASQNWSKSAGRGTAGLSFDGATAAPSLATAPASYPGAVTSTYTIIGSRTTTSMVAGPRVK